MIEHNQVVNLGITDLEYAASLLAGFNPVTGEETFFRPRVLQMIVQYNSTTIEREREGLLYAIGVFSGILDSQEAAEIYSGSILNLAAWQRQKVENFIAEQQTIPLDPCPTVHCEYYHDFIILILQRVELGRVLYGFSLYQESLIHPKHEEFSQLDFRREFGRTLAIARRSVDQVTT